MAIYNSKMLKDVLSNYLPNRKRIILEKTSCPNELNTNIININYSQNHDLWFFYFKINDFRSIFCFGLKNDNRVKLVLYVGKSYSLRFFNGNKIGIEIKFSENANENYHFLKKHFQILSPKNNNKIYYLMLFNDSKEEIISNITKLIKLVRFDFNKNKEFLIIKAPLNNKIYENNIKKVSASNITKTSIIKEKQPKKSYNKDIYTKTSSKLSMKKFNGNVEQNNSVIENNSFKNIYSKIVSAIDEGYKFIILESGHEKSRIASKLANSFGNSLILTGNNQSQKKYPKSNNFKVLTYEKAFKDFRPISENDKKELLIMDDAHKIEENIVRNFSYSFGLVDIENDMQSHIPNIKEKIKKLKNKDSSHWLNFFNQIYLEYSKCINLKRSNDDEYSVLMNNKKDVESIIDFLNENPNSICDYEDSYYFFGVTFTPINIGKILNKYLFEHAKVNIFMSQSILDYKKFCNEFNIDISEIKFIYSEFKYNSDKTEIFARDSVNMNIKSNIKFAIPIIEEILIKHAGDKGLIYVANSELKLQISKKINNNRLIEVRNENEESVIRQFKKSTNSVLISQNFLEGFEFPNNYCRFQIILKQPHELKNSLSNFIPDWKDYRDSINLVQMFTKSIKSENDYCSIYLLDENILWFIIQDVEKNKFIPKYIINSLVDVDVINHGFVSGNIKNKYGVYYLYDYIPNKKKHLYESTHPKTILLSNKVHKYKDYIKETDYCVNEFKDLTNDLKNTIVEFSNSILNDEIKKIALVSVPSSTIERDKTAPMRESIKVIAEEYSNGNLKSILNKEIIDCSNLLYRFSNVNTSHKNERRPCYREHMNSIKCQASTLLKERNVAFIILDDISTRGTILNACEDILIKNGVNKDNIFKLTLFKTVGDKND